MNITLSYYVGNIKKDKSFKNISELVNFVKGKTNIGEYKFQSCNLNHSVLREEDTKALAIALENMTNLQHLDLSLSLFDKALVPILAKMTNLRMLKLSRGFFRIAGAKGLATVLEKMTNLQEFYLSDSIFQEEDAKALATALEKMTNLQKFYLSGSFFGEEDAKAFAKALEKMTNLRHLDLSYSSFGEEGIKALVSVLEKMTNLRVLNLRGSDIAKETLQELKNKLPHCKISTGIEYEKEADLVDLIEDCLKVGLVVGVCIGLAIVYYAEIPIEIVAGLVLGGALLVLAGCVFAEVSEKVSEEKAKKPGTNTLTALTKVLTPRWLRSEAQQKA